MNVLAIGASNSSASINRKLVKYCSGMFEDAEVTLPDLNNFEMPIYSIDREREKGIPSLAYRFKEMIKDADLVMISFAEHNGSYTVAFKNIMDWVSRIEGDTWESKPFFLMATSPGRRGGQTVLNLAVERFKHMGAEVLGHFSLPSFHQNFSEEKGITDEALRESLIEQLNRIKSLTV